MGTDSPLLPPAQNPQGLPLDNLNGTDQIGRGALPVTRKLTGEMTTFEYFCPIQKYYIIILEKLFENA